MPTETSLPFAPRPLTRREQRRYDLYLYQSPKADRRVELIGCLATALSLRFEFDPDVVAFIERPRTLEVNDGRVELAFWTRETRNRERFWLLVPADDTLNPRSSRREYRHARALVEAAQAAHLSLEFVFEEDMRKCAPTLSTWYRLLPYVQTARALPNRVVLRQQVRSVFDGLAQATLDQIEGTLHSFHSADVRAAVCDLIHCGELSLVDTSRLSRFSVVNRRGGHDKA